MKISFILFSCVLLFTASACKKGCTDTQAINYNTAAKNEDGSCIYCDSTSSMWRSTISGNFFERRTNSPYYNSYVLIAYAQNMRLDYTGNGCRLYGLTGDGSCQKYYNTLTMYNRTSQPIELRGFITVQYFDNSSFAFQVLRHDFNGEILASFAYTDLGNIGGVCINADETFLSPSLILDSLVLTYQ